MRNCREPPLVGLWRRVEQHADRLDDEDVGESGDDGLSAGSELTGLATDEAECAVDPAVVVVPAVDLRHGG